MKISQLRLAVVLIAITFCCPASAGQSTPPEGWRKIGTDETISFLLPEDMKQTDVAGEENVVEEYTNGRMWLLIEFRPWGLRAPRKGHWHPRGVKGYREKEMWIDGRRAHIQTFSPNQNQKREGRTYGAELTVVTKEWAPYVELQVTFKGRDASDLGVAERIFASIHFPKERDQRHAPKVSLNKASTWRGEG
jgi:hypothetical protein